MHRRVCLAGIPILIFHGIARQSRRDLGADLLLPEALFARHLRALRRAGYQSLTCADLLAHLRGECRAPPRSLLLTFDDGYLDNWTIAGPLLRQYGFRATVFVASDCLQVSDDVRPDSDQVEQPEEEGFLSAAELRAMEASGLFEIQGHTASHARLPGRDEVLDFAHPGGVDLDEPEAEWGTPIYPRVWLGQGPALRVDAQLARCLREHVAEHGAEQFFAQADWRRQLRERYAAVAEGGVERESNEQYRQRLAADLQRNRQRLQQILGHSVDFLAWPGGGACKQAVDVALQAGFRATFGTDRPCSDLSFGPSLISRTYFGPQYRGPFAAFLRTLKLRGVADFEARRLWGYAQIFLANRLMRLLGQRS